jgi:hypothetical protein
MRSTRNRLHSTSLVAVQRPEGQKGVEICSCVLSFGTTVMDLSILFRIDQRELKTSKGIKIVKTLVGSALDATRKHRLTSSCNVHGEPKQSQYQSCINDIGRRIFLDDVYRTLDWSKSELIGLNG